MESHWFVFLLRLQLLAAPIEQKIAQLRFAGAAAGEGASSTSIGNDYGVSSEVIEALKKQYGFDKPIPIQYLLWLKNAVTFDFGDSFIYEEPAIDLILERIPISLQFGIISLILTYFVCIVLGVTMAVRKNSKFDIIALLTLIVLYSIPSLMLGVFSKFFLAGQLDWFPIGDLYSDMYFEKGFWGRILDRIHHFILAHALLYGWLVYSSPPNS